MKVPGIPLAVRQRVSAAACGSILALLCVGFTLAATAITAIYYGLSSLEKWNSTYNPQAPDTTAGQTNWLVIGAVVFSVLMGATALMSSIAFSFQRYFEYQIEEARKISQ